VGDVAESQAKEGRRLNAVKKEPFRIRSGTALLCLSKHLPVHEVTEHHGANAHRQVGRRGGKQGARNPKRAQQIRCVGASISASMAHR
jgi:hypothetical protein